MTALLALLLGGCAPPNAEAKTTSPSHVWLEEEEFLGTRRGDATHYQVYSYPRVGSRAVTLEQYQELRAAFVNSATELRNAEDAYVGGRAPEGVLFSALVMEDEVWVVK